MDSIPVSGQNDQKNRGKLRGARNNKSYRPLLFIQKHISSIIPEKSGEYKR